MRYNSTDRSYEKDSRGPRSDQGLACGLSPHLEAVLVGHELLGLALVQGLDRAAGGLRGRGPPRGPAGALGQVEVRHVDADVIAHEVLELSAGGREIKGRESMRGCHQCKNHLLLIVYLSAATYTTHLNKTNSVAVIDASMFVFLDEGCFCNSKISPVLFC